MYTLLQESFWNKHSNTEVRIAPKRLQYRFICFLILNSQTTWRIRQTSDIWVLGSQQLVKGNAPWFQLFLQVILLEVANESMFGK